MTDDDKALVERLWNRVEYRWDGQTQIREIDTDATYAAHRIEELSAENERLREALGWFLNDSRFVVQVGGNPNVVPQMIEAARAALGETE